ncbi:MAG: hypothetical protein HC831_05590 [Chloroflexia bacterium]|nr:hypothetical protein [Chloroflexia bacterium]
MIELKTFDGTKFEGFKPESLKGRGVNNALVNIKCMPSILINETELMNNVCDFIESKVGHGIKSQHVISNISTESSEKGVKINELSFQINW